jgi:hypothetical protein
MLLKDTGTCSRSSGAARPAFRCFFGRSSGKVAVVKGALSEAIRSAASARNESRCCTSARGPATCTKEVYCFAWAPASPAHIAANLAALECLTQVRARQRRFRGGDTAPFRPPRATDLLYLFLARDPARGTRCPPDTVDCVRCGESPRDGIYSPRDGVSFCAEHRAAVPEAVKLSPEIVAATGQCAEQPFDVLAREVVARGVRKELGRLVHWTYTYHVQGYHLPC